MLSNVSEAVFVEFSYVFRCFFGFSAGQPDGWKGGRTDGRTVGRTDGRADG